MPPTASLGRLFLVLAGLFFLIGIVLLFIPSLPRLPGDIYVQRKNFSCWVPVATSIVLSILLTVGLNLLLWLLRYINSGG